MVRTAGKQHLRWLHHGTLTSNLRGASQRISPQQGSAFLKPQKGVKNLSNKGLWNVAFMEGKDDNKLVTNNLSDPLEFIRSGFRCKEHLTCFREMFEVIEVQGQSLEEIASERDCFAADLLRILG